MALLGAKDLRFTRDEARAMFAQAGTELEEEALDEAMKRTGGWAIGLRAELLSGPGESTGTLRQYLDDYVWPRWEEPVRQFLLRCCIAQELEPELCRRLTGRPDAGDMLLALLGQGAFIAPLQGERYRLHDLFRDYLQERAREELNDENRDAARRAYADWLLSQKDYYAAMREYTLLLDGAGINRCLHIISDFSILQAVESEMNFAKAHVIGKLSDDFIIEKPYLLEMMPWSYFLDGNARGFTRWMDIMRNHIPRFMEEYPSLMETAGFMNSLDFRLPLRTIAVQLSEQMAQMPPPQEDAEEGKKAKSSSITQNLPYFHRSMRDYSEYHHLREEDLAMLRGTFGMMIGPEYPVYENCLVGGVLYEQNRLLDACYHALSAYRGCGEGAGPETVFSAQMLLASVLDSLGSTAQAEALYAGAEESIAQSGADYLMANLRAMRTRRAVRGGDTEAAAYWMAYFAADEATRAPLAYYRLARHFTTLEALLALSEWARADAFAIRLYKLARAYHRPLDLLEGYVLRAYALEQLGKPKDAEATLLRALALAQKYGFTRILIENANRVLPILNRIAAQPHEEKAFVKFLDNLRESMGKAHGLRTETEKTPLTLAPQMERMLRELQAGGSYAEIAERTGLAKSSVKTHLVRLYKVLDVHNAMEAVEKARMMGLLE